MTLWRASPRRVDHERPTTTTRRLPCPEGWHCASAGCAPHGQWQAPGPARDRAQNPEQTASQNSARSDGRNGGHNGGRSGGQDTDQIANPTAPAIGNPTADPTIELAVVNAAESSLRGLYAITSAALCALPGTGLLDGVSAALRGGARLIQYRDKQADSALRQRRAEALLRLCRSQGARLIINDDVELAAAIGADGVHLGAADPPLALARARLGGGVLLGASCGPSLARAEAAAAGGADYVAFGRFFPSTTKPDAPQAALELLDHARARFEAAPIPICAIGGITPMTAPRLIAHGADLIAAVEGVFGALQPAAIESAARDYARCFE